MIFFSTWMPILTALSMCVSKRGGGRVGWFWLARSYLSDDRGKGPHIIVLFSNDGVINNAKLGE